MIKLDFDQRRRANELMEYGFDDPDAIAEELIYLRDIVSGIRRESSASNACQNCEYLEGYEEGLKAGNGAKESGHD